MRALLSILPLLLPLHAATITLTNPADKFAYPNVADGGNGGLATKASTFATLNTDDEDRLSGYLLMFNTSSLSLPPSQYMLTSVKLTITVLTGDVFVYDNSFDSYRTSLLSNDPLYAGDQDDGKPVEVFGVGLRHGYNRLNANIGANPADGSYGELSAVVNGSGVRNVYPVGRNAGGALTDVSDNVSQHQEAFPFATGLTSTLLPGDLVPQGTKFTFTLELSNAAIRSYVENGFRDGVLGLYVSSLHGAEGQNGSDTFPRFYTREGAAPFSAFGFSPKLDVEYIAIPEPHLSGLLIAGAALFAAGRGFRHRNRLS